MPTPAPAPAPALKSFTVAKGRTVHADDDVVVSAGGSIDLDPAEGARLQKLGFLLNDDGDVVIDENAGPAVLKGAEIKEK